MRSKEPRSLRLLVSIQDSMPRLVLFDIDGTLIRDDGAAREAYAHALHEVYGHPGHVQKYDFSGKTDPDITHMVLGDAGVPRATIEEGMHRLWPIYLRGLEARTNRQRIQVLDGVQALLDRLLDHPEVTLALVTGNIEAGARVKLEPNDLNRYFLFGAFGSDSAIRDELPPIAVQRVRETLGKQFDERDVVIVGDSVFDVRCGVPHNATTIAVASGRTTRETLAAENPDHLLDSLANTEEALQAILGPH